MPGRTELYTKQIGLPMEEPLFDLIRRESSENGMPMAMYVRNVVRQALTGSMSVLEPEQEISAADEEEESAE